MRRTLVGALGALLYAVAAPLAVARGVHNFQLLLPALYLVVLPALIYGWHFRMPDQRPLASPRAALLLALYLIPALAMSWICSQGLLVSDESAYEFQAHIFAAGELQAEAPPGAARQAGDTPAPLNFEQHIIDHGKWFGKYPVGWPLLLALGLRVGAEWAVNPVLGLVILLLTYSIARCLYGSSVAALAVFLGILSPFFVANCIGRLSHAACGALLAGACWCCFEGLRTRRTGAFLGMFWLIVAACQVRPVTGAAVGACLTLGALWYVRRESLFGRLLALGICFGALAAGLTLLYDKIYTGRFLLSPYVLARPNGPAELDPHPLQLLYNLTHQTRWSLQDTVFYTFPFVFLLAAYAVWRERARIQETRILAALFPALVLAYLLEPQVGSVLLSGERYYFEGYFAVLILAARGIEILVHQLGTTRRAFVTALSLLAAGAVAQQVLAGRNLLRQSEPYREIHAAAKRYEGQRYVVFWRSTEPVITGKHFNLNRPDWQKESIVYLVDPGPQERDRWACRFSREHWVVIGYDPALHTVTEEPGNVPLCQDRVSAKDFQAKHSLNVMTEQSSPPTLFGER